MCIFSPLGKLLLILLSFRINLVAIAQKLLFKLNFYYIVSKLFFDENNQVNLKKMKGSVFKSTYIFKAFEAPHSVPFSLAMFCTYLNEEKTSVKITILDIAIVCFLILVKSKRFIQSMH